MTRKVFNAHQRQWQAWMILTLLDALLATAGLTGNFNHDGDYDGDGIMDPAVYDEPSGTLHVMLSENRFVPQSFTWGGPNWTAIQSDYDGDSRADAALYNRTTGVWYILYSRNDFATPVCLGTFGGEGWTAVTGDYDGDGMTDQTIYSEATGKWMCKLSRMDNATIYGQFGGPGYTAVSGDFDGDGGSDPAIYRRSNGQWLVQFSSRGYALKTCYVDTMGDARLVPSPADYDGDRKTDPAVFAYGNGNSYGKEYVFCWYVLYSSRNYQQIEPFRQLGREDARPSNADPAPGDYDGDGKADFGVSWPDFESAGVMWRLWKSSNNYRGHDDVNRWSGDDCHPVQR